MNFDFESLTMAEVKLIEEQTGRSIAELANQEKPQGVALASLAYVIKSREDSSFTWNDAFALTFKEVNALIGSTDSASEEEQEEEEKGSKPATTSKR